MQFLSIDKQRHQHFSNHLLLAAFDKQMIRMFCCTVLFLARRISASQHRLSAYSSNGVPFVNDVSNTQGGGSFFRGKPDFSRASYNEKHHRQQQLLNQTESDQKRSASTSSYHNVVSASISNNVPHFATPQGIQMSSSMYKSNTSLDLDHEVGLVEQAIEGVHIMPNDGMHLSATNQQHFLPPSAMSTATTTTTGNAYYRRHHLGHGNARPRDFSGSHGSIVDVLSTRPFINDDINAFEGSQSSNNSQNRYVLARLTETVLYIDHITLKHIHS